MSLRDKYKTDATPTPAPLAVESQPSSTPTPARDLAAVRARLAQRPSPGVNPPEAVIPPTAFDRTTEELPDGTAQPIEAGVSGLELAGGGLNTSGSGPTRGQKAAATRAANKNRAPRAAAKVVTDTSDQTDAEFAAEVKVAEQITLEAFSLEQLLREVFRRIQ